MNFAYYIVIQLISLLIGLIYFRYIKLFALQVMVPLLFFVFGIEIIATNAGLFGFKTNLYIYNTYVLLSPIFYFVLFLRLIKFQPKFKKIYITTSLVFFLFFIVDYFSIKPSEFNYYSLTISMVAYIILSLILLFQIVTDDTRQVPLVSEPYFWIASGIILFGLVSIIMLGLHTYIVRHQIRIGGVAIYRIIMPMVNAVLYSCFAYAFYLCKSYFTRMYDSEILKSTQ